MFILLFRLIEFPGTKRFRIPFQLYLNRKFLIDKCSRSKLELIKKTALSLTLVKIHVNNVKYKSAILDYEIVPDRSSPVILFRQANLVKPKI